MKHLITSLCAIIAVTTLSGCGELPAFLDKDEPVSVASTESVPAASLVVLDEIKPCTYKQPDCTGTLVVTGTIDRSWSAVTSVEMVSGDLSRVLAKCDIQTPIDAPATLFGFTCITKDIPEDKQFLVRFYAGDEQYAVVTNYPKRGEPTNECQFARGLIVQDIRVNGASLEHRIIDIAPEKATKENDCRQGF